MSEKLLPAAIILAGGALALGYGLGGLWSGVLLSLALSVCWLVAFWRDWLWMSAPGLGLCVVVAVGGLLLNLGTGWMLVGVVAALSAWDLDAFVQRLRDVEWVADRRALERRHLMRLLIVDLLGLALAAVALGIELRLSFVATILLSLLMILGLSRAVGFLRRESD